jgi:hypothetical protein
VLSEFVGAREGNQRGWKLEALADRVGESVTERIIISYNTAHVGSGPNGFQTLGEIDLLYLCDSEAALNKMSRWIGSGSSYYQDFFFFFPM